MGRPDWRVTGGYDPGRDGPDPRWGRVAVECSACGETRRIWRGLPPDDPGLAYGCPAEPLVTIAAGTITCERIVAWRPAHAGDCYYAGQDHPHRTCHGAITGPAPFVLLLPQLDAELAELAARRRVSAAITLGAVALVAFMVACIAAGWWPPLAVSWGAIMCDAGLITWGLVDRRRPV